MDKQLREYTDFARNFVNYIVVFSNIIKDHIRHLTTILKLFHELRLFLSAKKSFIRYLSMKLLRHLINALGMSTTKDRVAAFKNLKFPTTL